MLVRFFAPILPAGARPGASAPLRLLAAVSVLAVTLAGCASVLPEPHKIEIQQGTVMDPDKVAQLKIGMNQEQVRFLLGNPTINDVFHPDRWDYVYFETRSGQDAPVSRITLFFRNDTLIRIEDRLRPEPALADE